VTFQEENGRLVDKSMVYWPRRLIFNGIVELTKIAPNGRCPYPQDAASSLADDALFSA
jgi:hypothetical protein